MGSTTPPLPYWQTNIPPPLRTPQPPPFLTNLSPKDIGIISTPDDQYTLLTWPQVKTLITTNRIDKFQRLPSDLRRYLEFNYHLKQQWGSVMEFVMSQRLGWKGDELESASGRKPFERESDLKVLWNDWPYGIDGKIVHLVIWTKFELVDDAETGELTTEARGEIESYVEKTFVQKCGKENVIWFKNWKSLKSIHAVEHFHVMLYDPDPKFVEEITGGDITLSKRV